MSIASITLLVVEKMSPSSYEFKMRPNIYYRVQIWTLTQQKKISLIDFFSSHFLVVFATWAGALSCRK